MRGVELNAERGTAHECLLKNCGYFERKLDKILINTMKAPMMCSMMSRGWIVVARVISAVGG